MKTAVNILVSPGSMLLIYIPYVVSGVLMFGVKQAKAIWFYGAALLIIIPAHIYPAIKKKAAIPFALTLTLWVALYVVLKARGHRGIAHPGIRLYKALRQKEKVAAAYQKAIDVIKQEMKNILTAGNPENKGPETERAKPSAIRKDAGGKDDV